MYVTECVFNWRYKKKKEPIRLDYRRFFRAYVSITMAWLSNLSVVSLLYIFKWEFLYDNFLYVCYLFMLAGARNQNNWVYRHTDQCSLFSDSQNIISNCMLNKRPVCQLDWKTWIRVETWSFNVVPIYSYTVVYTIQPVDPLLNQLLGPSVVWQFKQSIPIQPIEYAVGYMKHFHTNQPTIQQSLFKRLILTNFQKKLAKISKNVLEHACISRRSKELIGRCWARDVADEIQKKKNQMLSLFRHTLKYLHQIITSWADDSV